MALHSSRYVRDTLEHDPDTMFQLRLDEVQVFDRMGVQSKRRLSFPSRLADIRESAWQQEQARMRQGRDRDDGWRRIQVCVEDNSGSDSEARNISERRNENRLSSHHGRDKGRTYKSHNKQSMPFYEDYVNAASQHRMTSSYVEHHGMMTEPPPALFTYHNVQKKSCLVEESEEEEREEESEFFESEEDFVEACVVEEEEEEIGEEADLGDDCGRGREMSPSSSVKSLQAEARRRFSVGDPCFQFPSQPYVDSPASLYIQPEDRLNYILEEEEEEVGSEHEEEDEEEERITFSIEEEEEEDYGRYSLSDCEGTPTYIVEEEEEQEERFIPIVIEDGGREKSFHPKLSPNHKELARETNPQDLLTRQEKAAEIGAMMRQRREDMGSRLRRNTRDENVSAIGDLIKDLSAELEQLKENRRVLESLRRHSSTEAPVMAKPPKGQSSGGGVISDRVRRPPARAEFTTYADLLETMCPTSMPRAHRQSSSTAHRQPVTSRRHSSVVIPKTSSLVSNQQDINKKLFPTKRFSPTRGSLIDNAFPLVKEEKEQMCETYSCDQLVTRRSLSVDSLDSATSHSPSSSKSSLSSTESISDTLSDLSSESELMSDPASCDELWLLPQQVLAMDVDVLQAELPLSGTSAEDLRAEDLRFARASPSKSTFWMYSVVQGRLRSC